MVNSLPHQFQYPRYFFAFYLLFLLFFLCPNSWAVQDAMVISDRAFVYSDTDMTGPVGYISRGKKIVVGEIPRNKAQVYPIMVSGKVAYIRVIDVTTEKASIDSNRLVAERFKKNTDTTYKSRVSLSYLSFNSQIDMGKQNGDIASKDSLAWSGVSLRGDVIFQKTYDAQILLNYLTTSMSEESFSVFEFGAGVGYRLIDKSRFMARVEAQLLVIPFASYALGSDFRVKSAGHTLGSGGNMSYRFGDNWGLEFGAGLYYTKLFGFGVPKPYTEIAPSFVGTRFNLGLNFTY